MSKCQQAYNCLTHFRPVYVQLLIYSSVYIEYLAYSQLHDFLNPNFVKLPLWIKLI